MIRAFSIRRARALAVSALVVAAALPGPVAAQASKPGLWEIEQKMQLDATQQKQMDEARKQMAAMPPEQRKMFEDMMAKSGIGTDLATGGSKMRICLSKEDAAREGAPIDKRGDCSYEPQKSGAISRIKYRCTAPPSQGEIEITSVSPERYTMKMAGTAGANGRPIAMQSEGRWLGADCGALKPAVRPARP